MTEKITKQYSVIEKIKRECLNSGNWKIGLHGGVFAVASWIIIKYGEMFSV